MGRHFAEIAFTPLVQAEQERIGSRAGYARMAERAADDRLLGPAEAAFIAERDSFYLSSVGESGWPYVQHRGGPPGFLRVLDPGTLGFADLSGNKQHITIGNTRHDDRVSLFLMDYPRRQRLKLFGRLRIEDDPAIMAGWPASGRAQRAMLVEVAGYDWNCPQHITPRFSAAELAPLLARLEAAEAEVARLRAEAG